MDLPAWREEPIVRRHDRAGFDCGQPALNEFLQRHARRSHEEGGAKTFVAVSEADGATVLGYYSLCPATISFDRAPHAVRRGLARHEVPGFRLARLGVARPWQGQGLGSQLLLCAGRRCVRVAAEVGGVLLVIDAKDRGAAAWYSRFGAVPLDAAPLTLLLPLSTIAAAT